jgi:hypothetical protein
MAQLANFNKDNQEVKDETIFFDGNGGGLNLNGGGGGGSSKPINIIKGCTDPTSLSYNPNATVDDGSCQYEVSTGPVKEKTLSLNLIPNLKQSKIVIDGKETNELAPKILVFTATELLSPKTITVSNSNKKAKEEYVIYAIKNSIRKEIKPIVDILPDVDTILENTSFKEVGVSITGDAIKSYGTYDTPVLRNLGNSPLKISSISGIPDVYTGYTRPVSSDYVKKPELILGDIFYDYYTFVIEKRGANNTVKIARAFDSELDSKGLSVLLEGNDAVSTQATATLSFTLESTNPPALPIPYVVDIECDLAGDGIIQYITSWGDSGKLPSTGKIQLSGENLNKPSIEFFGIGISSYTHKVSYEYIGRKPIENIDSKFEIQSYTQTIVVKALRTEITPPPTKPNIKVESEIATYNINSEEPLKIGYQTTYTDEVLYKLGKTEKKLSRSGSLILTKSDFLNGVGNYIIYLQPISERGGTGDYKKIIINVISKDYIPGPDITHINYPQNIKGADFKEYNVPFKISWQSINTNYIKIFVGKKSDNTYLGQFPNASVATFNVEEVLRKAGDNLDSDANIIQFKLLLVPFNEEGDELTEGKIEEITITFDKGDLKLRRGDVLADLRKSFLSNIDNKKLIRNTSSLLSHYLHIGEGNNRLISTWGIDDLTFSEKYTDTETNETKYKNVEKSLVLKLYEPLPRNINTNDVVWVSKIQSVPLIDTIEITEDFSKNCTPLVPNFNLNVTDSIGYEVLDDLIASGSTSSTELVNEFVSSSNFNLSSFNIQFAKQKEIVVEEYSGSTANIIVSTGVDVYNWDSFVKYSSAEERSENFLYKVKLIEAYSTSIADINTRVSTVSLSNEKTKLQSKISDVKKGFDSFETYLYNSTGSLTYPGAGLNELSASTDSDVTSWYTHIVSSSKHYDYYNPSRLSYNLPEYIKEDDKNDEFTLFFDMIGQHFDIIHTHIKGISQSKKLEHKQDIGIKDDLVYHLLESFGFDADVGAESQLLWEHAFGYWDKNKNTRTDGSSKSVLTAKDKQQQIWRRLLNNLPYLNKHKGTKRALHAAMSCYGVPASLLTIMEFGGPKDPTQDGTTKFTFEDRTLSINFTSGSLVTVPWKPFISSLSTDYPNSVEIRVNTEQRQDQRIFSGSEWSLDIIKDTGSLAKVKLTVGPDSASTEAIPFFNDEYQHITVTRTSGSLDSFQVFVKEGFQGRIRNQSSASISSATTKAWTSGSELHLGDTFIGSVDEFRLWRTPLSESRVDNHTLMPDAIDGNHISASTHDLIFRNDFEYPKNRHSGGDVDIKNVALVTTYCTSSVASGFDSKTTYPYQYTPYDRDVTANIPSTGFNFANKVRFESQTKLIDLNYRSRATKKSFDQSPVDSNRLGLFFSPIKEINLDILKGLGEFNIDNYIGNPSDEYSDEYSDLKKLRNYYFSRYTLNLHEYIQLVRYIDKSLFKTLESLVPARAKVASGLLIEPHILERSKTKWNKPTGSINNFSSTIDIEEDVNLTSTNPQYNVILSASQDVNLIGTNPQYIGTIDTESDVVITSVTSDYSATVATEDIFTLEGSITRNSGSDMGGISITVDAKMTGSVQGQYDSTAYQQVGMDIDGISKVGFGLYGSGSHAIRTRLFNNNIVKDRVKVFLLNESYTEDVPQNISNDSSQGTQLVTQTKYRNRVSILPFTGSDGLEASTPSGGNIVSVTPLNGYFPTHYRNVGDLTSGMENSFFNGSKQTSTTTLDGGSPVQTFTTNPNTLRVSDSGRGSGEPILEVD